MKPPQSHRSWASLMILLFFVIQAPTACSLPEDTQQTLARSTWSVAYVESLPISIVGNDDFASQAASNLWPGNGSAMNPFRISGLNITTSEAVPLISIMHTDVYFVLSDNLLQVGSVGVLFDNVTNGVVVSNTIAFSIEDGILAMVSKGLNISFNTIRETQSGAPGVCIHTVTETIVDNNTISDCGDRGILADYCERCNLTRNVVSGSTNNGINLRDSFNMTLQENEVYQNTNTGIVLGNSDSVTIVDNIVHHNTFSGIDLGESSDANIHGNILYNNTDHGLSLVASPSSNVTCNTVLWHAMYGLIIGSNVVNVSRNNFIDNFDAPAVAQAADNGAGNVFSSNFWSDWTSPDEDSDGVVDSQYSVEGIPGNTDQYPRTSVYLEPRLHVVIRPYIMEPRVDTVLQGRVNITWGKSSDTLGHEVSYSVFVDNGSASWISLADDIIQTVVEWTIDEKVNGSAFVLRVIAKCSEGLEAECVSGPHQIQGHILPLPRILAPVPGALINETTTITWSGSQDSLGHSISYAVYFSHDNASHWSWLGNTSDTSLYWDASNAVRTDMCLVRVIATCSSGLSAEEVMDGPFTLNNHTITGLQVTEPQGGEEYTTSPIRVSWTEAYDSWGHVIWYTILLSNDSGQSWMELATGVYGDHFDWDTRGFGGENDYLIKVIVRCLDGITCEDVSDSTFAIPLPESLPYIIPTLVVIAVVAIAVAILLGARFLKKR